MSDSEKVGEQGNELKRALAQRRKVVDAEGSKFVKDPLLLSGSADFSWEEHHESQFTPRGKNKKVDVETPEESSRKDIRVNASSEKPSHRTVANRSSKTNVKPSAKSRLAQFTTSASSTSSAVPSACRPAPEAEADRKSPNEAVVVQPAEAEHLAIDNESATRSSVAENRIASQPSKLQQEASSIVPSLDVTSPLVHSSALPECDRSSLGEMHEEVHVTKAMTPHKAKMVIAPAALCSSLDISSSLAIAPDVAEPSSAPISLPMKLDVTSPCIAPTGFEEKSTIAGMEAPMAESIFEEPTSNGATTIRSEQDVTMPSLMHATPSLATASFTGSDHRKVAETKKSKLLLPKDFDFKLPPLDELPPPSSTTDKSTKGSTSLLSDGIAALEQTKVRDCVPEPEHATTAKSPPDVMGVFDKRKPAAAPPSVSLTSQTAQDRKLPGAKKAPPEMEHRPHNVPQAGQNGDGNKVRDQRLWHAVVEGDVRMLEDLANQGILSSGRISDHNGHSIFWNAVAFQQLHAALWLLKRFPPDAASGVDLREVHARRGDSLLHMCLYFSECNAAGAELFQRVFFCRAPRSLLNQNGQSFLTIAASRLNFWVIRFAITHAADCVDLLLVRDKAGNSPIAILQKRVGEVSIAPSIPSLPAPPEMKLPFWCALKQYNPVVVAVDSKPPIFSDLILEVEDSSASNSIVQVAAHRVVVASCSCMLDDHRDGAAIRVDSRCCRSVEVLLTMLHFCYSGQLIMNFSEDGFLLWQLLCLCAQNGLPPALVSYVRALLVRSLANPKYAEVSSVLLQASSKLDLTQGEIAFTARSVIAHPAAALASIDEASEKAALLDSVLAQIEQYVMQESRSSVCAPGKRMQAQNVPLMQVFDNDGQPSYNNNLDRSVGGPFAQPPPTPALGTR